MKASAWSETLRFSTLPGCGRVGFSSRFEPWPGSASREEKAAGQGVVGGDGRGRLSARAWKVLFWGRKGAERARGWGGGARRKRTLSKKPPQGFVSTLAAKTARRTSSFVSRTRRSRSLSPLVVAPALPLPFPPLPLPPSSSLSSSSAAAAAEGGGLRADADADADDGARRRRLPRKTSRWRMRTASGSARSTCRWNSAVGIDPCGAASRPSPNEAEARLPRLPKDDLRPPPLVDDAPVLPDAAPEEVEEEEEAEPSDAAACERIARLRRIMGVSEIWSGMVESTERSAGWAGAGGGAARV